MRSCFSFTVYLLVLFGRGLRPGKGELHSAVSSACPRVLVSPGPRSLSLPSPPSAPGNAAFPLSVCEFDFFFFFFLVPPPSDSRNARLRKRGSFHSAPCPLGSSALSWARPLFQGCVIFHSVRAARCPDLSVRAQTLRSSQYRGCRRRGVQKAPGAAVRCPLS